MAEPAGLGEVVGDHDDGLLERSEDGAEVGLQLGADHRVECPQGLVEQDHLGVEHQSAHQADTLALAARKLRGKAVEPFARESASARRARRAGRRSGRVSQPRYRAIRITLSRAVRCGKSPPSWMT